MSCDWVGASEPPRTAVLIAARDRARLAPAAPPRLVLEPRFSPSILRAPPCEVSTRIYAIHSSGPPLACSARDGTAAVGLSLKLHTADQEPTSHAEVGTGRRARPGTTTRSTSHPSIRESIVNPLRTVSVSQRSCGTVYVARMMRHAPLAPIATRTRCLIDRVSDSRVTQTHR